MKINRFLPLLCCFFCLSWASCSDEDTPAGNEEEFEIRTKVHIVFPVNGPGDNGYMDKVMKAAMKFSLDHPDIVRIHIPADSESADVLYFGIDVTAGVEFPDDSVLSVFIGSEYKDLLYKAEPPESKLKVLLLEDDGKGAPEWLNTCQIDRFGISYLSGAMVSQQSASIIAAMPDDSSLKVSIDGFMKGYEKHAGHKLDSIYYLSDSYDGFNMQSKARRLSDSILIAKDGVYHTIYPLAGSANQGVYNSLKDWYPLQAIGMDNDYSVVTDMIPFSVNVGIDMLLLDCMEKWLTSGTMQKHRSEGLGTPYIDLIFNKEWNEWLIFNQWEDIINTEQLTYDFWKQRYAKFIEEAKQEEKAYENN